MVHFFKIKKCFCMSQLAALSAEWPKYIPFKKMCSCYCHWLWIITSVGDICVEVALNLSYNQWGSASWNILNVLNLPYDETFDVCIISLGSVSKGKWIRWCLADETGTWGEICRVASIWYMHRGNNGWLLRARNSHHVFWLFTAQSVVSIGFYKRGLTVFGSGIQSLLANIEGIICSMFCKY